jgi:hypothetical protein
MPHSCLWGIFILRQFVGIPTEVGAPLRSGCHIYYKKPFDLCQEAFCFLGLHLQLKPKAQGRKLKANTEYSFTLRAIASTRNLKLET